MFILVIVLFAIAIVGGVIAVRLRRQAAARAAETGGPKDGGRSLTLGSTIVGWLAAATAALGAVLLFTASFFTQDVGQSSVLRDWTGNIVGYEQSSGFHWKAPWVDPVTFDVRNQRVVYSGATDSYSDNAGGVADGPQITVQDASGVTSNIDIAIRYSIKPDAVIDIYSEYQNEFNLQTRLIFNDVRSVVRSVPGRYETLELLTQRDDVQQAIQDALTTRWVDDGILVEDVALREIRIPESVQASYSAAQEAEINVETERANLEAAEVSAQQKVVQAQADADANRLLEKSLTDRILQQRYLDTLQSLAAAGNLVIVPEGFDGLVNVDRGQR